MPEARFIYILDSKIYHLLPIGNNSSIDNLKFRLNISFFGKGIQAGIKDGYSSGLADLTRNKCRD